MNTPTARYRSVAEVDAFIDLLRAACEDGPMNAALQHLLALPARRRQGFVRAWVAELAEKNAPLAFREAIACLVDDAVAARAHDVLGGCDGIR